MTHAKGADEKRARLERVAMMRFVEGLTWERIARELQVERKNLYLWRQSPEWKEAKARILDMMKAEGPDTAWGCLMRQAQHGDVAAAKEILLRTEGAVTQRQELTGSGGAPLFAGMDDEQLERLLASTAVGDPGGTGAAEGCGAGGAGGD